MSIAGGDYWKNIVSDYRNKKINGYQAERRLSVEYKQRLKQRYKYVLDMPIRLKEGQRPKYRMIHVCDHEDGCFLMAQNMQKQKEELFFRIQKSGQLSLFDLTSDYTSSVEGELLTREDVGQKVMESLNQVSEEIRITKFLALFVNEHGLICEFKMVYDILEEFNIKDIVDIIREPEKTKGGQLSKFWEEKDGRKVTIRRHRT